MKNNTRKQTAAKMFMLAKGSHVSSKYVDKIVVLDIFFSYYVELVN